VLPLKNRQKLPIDQQNSGVLRQNLGFIKMNCGVLKILALPALAAALVLGRVHAASPGYLAKTGPAPMRFQVIKPPPINLAELAKAHENPPVEPSVEAVPAVAEVSPVEPPPTPVAPPIEMAAPIEAPLETLLPKPAEPVVETKPEPPAANEMLVISPQMILEFLRAGSHSTNGTGVSTLVPVSFTPPTPAPAQSSRAVYRTE
jgi:Predicted membrane protein